MTLLEEIELLYSLHGGEAIADAIRQYRFCQEHTKNIKEEFLILERIRSKYSEFKSLDEIHIHLANTLRPLQGDLSGTEPRSRDAVSPVPKTRTSKKALSSTQ